MEFDSGCKAIDGEHRVQIGLAVALADAIRHGRPKTERDGLVDHLLTYTKVHFTAEHLLMRQYAYPEYRAHELEHDELLEQVEDLKRIYDAGNDDATLRQVGRVHAWLLGHIRATDERLAAFLAPLVPADG